MKITICGGGNLGHTCAGFLAAQSGNNVSLLTRKPELWSRLIKVYDTKGNVYRGLLNKVTNCPEDVIPEAEMVLICLPGFAIGEVLQTIAPFLKSACWVGSVVSSTGFFFEAFKYFPKKQPLFGFQRVPFISRIKHYGSEAELKGYKDSLSVAIEHASEKEKFRSKLEDIFKTPVKLLSSHYEVSLSNSNPLLHTSRLFTMFKNWIPGITYDLNPGFYSDWTFEASLLYIAMDEELQLLLRKLGVKEGSIPTVLTYYESQDAESLTEKIRSIPAFQGIKSPMVLNEEGRYVPDFASRYFIEDFPFGLGFTYNLAQENNLDCPNIEMVYKWGISKCNGR